MSDRHLTVEEVAARYHLTKGAIYTARHRGEAPGVLAIKVGRRLVWRESDLLRWEDDQVDAQRQAVAAR